MSSFETLIGNAINGDDRSLSRFHVKTAVVQEMFCQHCKGILDQRSATYIEFGKDAKHGARVLCPDCAGKFDQELIRLLFKSSPELSPITEHTWKGETIHTA